MRISRGIRGLVFAAALCAAPAVPSTAQIFEPLYVVDVPTAGMLGHGSYLLMGRVGRESSFLVDARLGFRGRFLVGVSYGMQRILEAGDPEFNDRPGFQFRLRVFEENAAPALAVGFDSQGFGVYDEALERYERKSFGFYAVVSKNYALTVGELSLHGGLSFSLEGQDNTPNPFAAVDWTVFERLSFLLAGDAALNDNSPDSYGKGGIYIDAGLKWQIAESWSMSLIFRDLSGNSRVSNNVGRELELAWIDFF